LWSAPLWRISQVEVIDRPQAGFCGVREARELMVRCSTWTLADAGESRAG